MTSELPRVAVVGRPNVGKSRLFNRLCGRRIAIVHDQPGVTRDVIAADIDGYVTLLDTGGIGMEPEMTPPELQAATEEQVAFSIQAANLILFVVDGQEGCTPLDLILAGKLRAYDKSIILVVNKVDVPDHEERVGEFYQLGLGEPQVVSAEHGHGMEELWQAIETKIGAPRAPQADATPSEEDQRVPICFVGRPNVGKSSICNWLLKADRMIVSDIPGTTRDAVGFDLDYTTSGGEQLHFRLFDTAGLKPTAKVSSPVEYFSGLRSRQAMEHSRIAFLVLDALEGVTKLDKRIAGEAMEFGVGMIVVVNKWDYALEKFRRDPLPGYDSEEEFRKAFAKAVHKELFFLPQCPVLFVSAKRGHGMDDILSEAARLHDRLGQKLSTARINRVLNDLVSRNNPRLIASKRFKIYYAVQIGNYPFRIRMYCNSTEHLEHHYRRYLESGLEAAFDLRGCPIRIELQGKLRYAERSDKDRK